MKAPHVLTVTFSVSIFLLHVIVARQGHTSVVLLDGSVLVMGGYTGGYRNDVWKTVNGGVSWILVTSSRAEWTGKKMLVAATSKVCLMSLLQMRGIHPVMIIWGFTYC
jgi:hypothetical protein